MTGNVIPLFPEVAPSGGWKIVGVYVDLDSEAGEYRVTIGLREHDGTGQSAGILGGWYLDYATALRAAFGKARALGVPALDYTGPDDAPISPPPNWPFAA